MKLSLLSIIYFQKPLIEEKVLLSAAIPLLQYLLRAKLICNKVGCDFKKQTKESIKFCDTQGMTPPDGYTCLRTRSW